MANGTVKWFNNTKKYGFIKTEDGREVFVHFSAILKEGFKTLRRGQKVEFEIEAGPKGEKAVNVKELGDGGAGKGKEDKKDIFPGAKDEDKSLDSGDDDEDRESNAQAS